jgi:hypothetical protein
MVSERSSATASDLPWETSAAVRTEPVAPVALGVECRIGGLIGRCTERTPHSDDDAEKCLHHLTMVVDLQTMHGDVHCHGLVSKVIPILPLGRRRHETGERRPADLERRAGFRLDEDRDIVS